MLGVVDGAQGASYQRGVSRFGGLGLAGESGEVIEHILQLNERRCRLFAPQARCVMPLEESEPELHERVRRGGFVRCMPHHTTEQDQGAPVGRR